MALLLLALAGAGMAQQQANVDTDEAIHEQWTFNHLTADQGLSNNFVHAICQDKYGYIWLATSFGLNRFNGLSVKQYFYNPKDSSSLNSNFISSLFFDLDDQLWIGTDKGLHLYDYDTQSFSRVNINDGRAKREIFSICQDLSGSLLVGTSSGLYKANTPHDNMHKVPLMPLGMPSDSVYRILVDEHNNLWLSTFKTGLHYYNRQKGYVRSFRHDPHNTHSIAEDWVFCIYKDKDQHIWIGTYNNGFSKFDKAEACFENHYVDPDHEFTKRIRTIFEDRYGRLFIGSRQGLYLYNREQQNCTLYALNTHPVTVLSQNSVTCSFQDRDRNIWLGTHSGGASYFNMLQKEFVHYRSVPNDNRFLNTKEVHCFDKLGNKLYVGTEKGLNILDTEKGTFTYLFNDPNDKYSLSYNDVKSICIQSTDSIWVATNNGGLNLLGANNRVKKVLRHHPKDPGTLPNDKLYNVFIDHTHTMWVLSNTDWDRSSAVLSRYIPQTDNFKHYNGEFFMGFHETPTGDLYVGGSFGFFKYDRQHDDFECYTDKELIYRTESLYMDNWGQLWLGTLKGLFKFDPKQGTFWNANQALQLGPCEVYGLLGKNDQLWFSSNNGLVRLKHISQPHQITTGRFTKPDGLQSREFNYNAYHADAQGQYYFGGNNGFNRFYPDQITESPYKPSVCFSALWADGAQVQPKQKLHGHVVLQKAISETKAINLSYKVTVFTLYIDVLHYANAHVNQYKYRIQANDAWTYVDATNNQLAFRGLQPGNYRLEVYGISSDGNQSPDPIRLHIEIKPPFWQTSLFRVLAALLFLLMLLLGIRRQLNKMRNHQLQLQRMVDKRTKELALANTELLEQKTEVMAQKEEIQQQRDTIIEKSEQLEAYAATLEQKVYRRTIDLEDAKVRAEESDRLKTAFLENMSHEVRTPLNSIIGFIDIIISDITNKDNRVYFDFIKMSSHSLMQIIENIIDFSRIESGTFDVYISTQELKPLMDELFDKVNAELQSNNEASGQQVSLQLNHKATVSNTVVRTDIKRVKQVFDNLLSNAVKFTHSGQISFGLETLDDGTCTFYVQDSGIGIDAIDQENIFQRFRKLEDKASKLYRGGGLGLSICKCLVQHLGGNIWVESVKDQGSTFHFTVKNHSGENQLAPIAFKSEVQPFKGTPNWANKTILIVEDENSNYQLLKLLLAKTNVRTLHAWDGQEAVDLFLEHSKQINLILMDIKLPIMSGYEASELIKAHDRRMPIIAQTAYTLSTDIKQFKELILDDFISKPINKDELYAKVNRWLMLR